MDRHHDENTPVYTISIAARLAGVHPQTLRIYERHKIIKPRRSSGNIRLYSQKDIEKVKEAQRIIKQYGVNIAGIRLILELEEKVDQLIRENEALRKKITDLTAQSSRLQGK